MNPRKHAVLGAGPMGLICALELLKQGQSVDIYERDDRIGGMSATFDFDGLAIERYYHFICKTDQPLFDLLREVGIEDRLRWVDTKLGLFCDGRLYAWGTPLALLRFNKIGWIDKLRYVAHVMFTLRINDWRALDKVNALDWLKRWVGARNYRVLWQRLLQLKFFEYSDRLSAAWLGTRIKRVGLSRRNMLQESMGYLEGGSKILLDALVKRVEELGGRIHLGCGVERVNAIDGHVRGIVVNGEEIVTDVVLSTAPIPYVPRLVPDLPEDFVARIRAIVNIPVVCVILKLKQQFTPYFWMNICDERIDTPGIIEYSNLNPCNGANIVYAPYYMPATHPKFARDNSVFIEETLGYLERINPEFSRDWVIATYCHRYEFAQTLCPPGFYDMLPPMQTPLAGFFMADTSYYYPEDRSISESARVGQQLAQAAMAGARDPQARHFQGQR